MKYDGLVSDLTAAAATLEAGYNADRLKALVANGGSEP